MDPFERFMYRRKPKFNIREGLWDNGKMFIINKDIAIEVPHYHFNIFSFNNSCKKQWKMFSNGMKKINRNGNSWRIMNMGIIPNS